MFKCKRIVSIISALCIVFTSLFSVSLMSSAADSNSSKMIHAKTDWVGRSFAKTISKDKLTSGAEYEVSFEYCVKATKNLDDRNYVAFKDENKAFSEIKLLNGRNDSKISFKYNGNADLKLNFYYKSIDKFAEVYVWDLKLTKKGSTENLLKDISWTGVTSIDASSGFGVEEVEYDSKIVGFKNPMIHAVTDYNWKSFNKTVDNTKLTKGNEYELSFEYYVKSENDLDGSRNSFVIKETNNIFAEEKLLLKGRNEHKVEFTYNSDKPLQPTFSYKSTDENAEIYVWNVKLVKKGDTVNLLENISWGGVGDLDAATGYGVEETEYKSEIVGLKNPMIHAVTNYNWQSFNKTVDNTKLTKGNEYELSFEYYVKSENDLDGSRNSFVIKETNNVFAEEKLLLKGRNEHKVEFTYNSDKPLQPTFSYKSTDKNAEIYVWNVKLVKIGDTVNLLENISWGGVGDLDAATGYGVEEIEYDESVVGFEKQNMTQIILPEGNTGNEVYKLISGFKVGSEYELSFEYFLSNDSGNYYFKDISNGNSFAEEKLKKGRHTVTKSFTFNYDPDIMAPGVWSNSALKDINLYIFNVKLVEKGSSVNMFDTVKWNDETRAVDVLYDESKFIVDGPKMTQIVLPEGNTGSEVYKLIDGFKVGSEYELSFEYFLSNDSGNYYFKDISKGNSFAEEKLIKGRHTVTRTFTFNYDANIMAPGIWSNSVLNGINLYIFNVKLVEKGSSVNMFEAAKWTDTAKAVEIPYDEDLFKETEIKDEEGVMQRFDFDASDSNGATMFKAKYNFTPGKKYTVSFDYYFTGGAALRIQDITGKYKPNGMPGMNDETTGYCFLDIGCKSSYKHTVTLSAEKMAVGFNVFNPQENGTLFVWNYRIVEVGDSTNTNLAAGIKWSASSVISSEQIDYDESLFVPNGMGEKGSSKMLKLDSYYYDNESKKIIIDQEVSQRFGNGQNGVKIKPNTTYVFSFDYYCSEDCVGVSAVLKTLYTHYEYSNRHLWTTRNKRGVQLSAGRGSVVKEFTTESDQTDFILGFAQGTDGTSYFWNIKLVEKGSDVNLFPNSDFSYGLKKWFYPTKYSDSTKASDQIEVLDLNPEMMALEKGGLLPNEEQAFYNADLWGAGDGDTNNGYKNTDLNDYYDDNNDDDSPDENFDNTADEDNETNENDGEQQQTVKIIKRRKKRKSSSNGEETQSSPITAILISAGAVVIAAGGATGFILIKKRKKV